jgi:hypothetical protein
MSYQNFKPDVWSTQLLMARDLKCVATQNSYKGFDKDIKAAGDEVHIQGIVGATWKALPADGVLATPEIIADDSMILKADQKEYFSFKVNDIDALQSNVTFKSSVISKTGNDLAVMQDKFVYDTAIAGAGFIVDGFTAATSAATIIAYLSAARAYIASRSSEAIMVELHPYIFGIIQQAILNAQTPNDSISKNGFKGSFLGMQIYESQNIKVTSDSAGATVVAPGTASAYYHNIIRTQEAIAYGEMKSLSPEAFKGAPVFIGEGVLGYTVYGAKVIRPLELVNFKAKM